MNESPVCFSTRSNSERTYASHMIINIHVENMSTHLENTNSTGKTAKQYRGAGSNQQWFHQHVHQNWPPQDCWPVRTHKDSLYAFLQYLLEILHQVEESIPGHGQPVWVRHVPGQLGYGLRSWFELGRMQYERVPPAVLTPTD